MQTRRHNARLVLQFNVGDLVMVAAWGNCAPRVEALPRWQEPYEILAAISTTAYDVRLLVRPNREYAQILQSGSTSCYRNGSPPKS